MHNHRLVSRNRDTAARVGVMPKDFHASRNDESIDAAIRIGRDDGLSTGREREVKHAGARLQRQRVTRPP